MALNKKPLACVTGSRLHIMLIDYVRGQDFCFLVLYCHFNKTNVGSGPGCKKFRRKVQSNSSAPGRYFWIKKSVHQAGARKTWKQRNLTFLTLSCPSSRQWFRRGIKYLKIRTNWSTNWLSWNIRWRLKIVRKTGQQRKGSWGSSKKWSPQRA